MFKNIVRIVASNKLDTWNGMVWNTHISVQPTMAKLLYRLQIIDAKYTRMDTDECAISLKQQLYISICPIYLKLKHPAVNLEKERTSMVNYDIQILSFLVK